MDQNKKQNKNKLNPNNSSLTQMLLDLQTVACLENEHGISALCSKLLEELKNKNSLQKKVDDKFNAHKYNQKNITYSKLENFKNLKFVNNLSSNSVKLLFLIIQTASQDNLIEIRVSVLMEVLKLSKPTVIKCLSELVDVGAISVMRKKNKLQGTIYMLNPKIASVGKHTHSKIYKTIAQESSMSTFEKLNSYDDYNIISSSGYIPINKDENKYLTYNTLDKMYDEDLSDCGLL